MARGKVEWRKMKIEGVNNFVENHPKGEGKLTSMDFYICVLPHENHVWHTYKEKIIR